MRVILGIGLLLALVSVALGDDKKEDKIDGKLLVGKWELVEPALATGKLVVEYKADGKLIMEVTVAKTTGTDEGEYKLEGNTLTQYRIGDNGKKEVTAVRTITKLTAESLE